MKESIHCTYTDDSQVQIQIDGVATLLHTAHNDKKQFGTPGDMLVGALGACTLTMMSVVANKYGENLSGAKIDLTPTFGPNLSGLKSVHLHIVFPPELSTETRSKCLAAAEICPVHKSLNPNIRFTITSV